MVDGRGEVLIGVGLRKTWRMRIGDNKVQKTSLPRNFAAPGRREMEEENSYRGCEIRRELKTGITAAFGMLLL